MVWGVEMSQTTVVRTLQETSVVFGLIILPVSLALKPPVHLIAIFITAVSVIIYIAARRLFQHRAAEDHREAMLNRVGRISSNIAVVICVLFSIFIIIQQDVERMLIDESGDLIQIEMRALKSTGQVIHTDATQLPEAIQKLNSAVYLNERGSTIHAPTAPLLRAIYSNLLSDIRYGFRYIFIFAVIWSAIVFLVGWFGKTIIIPALPPLQAHPQQQ
jgi:hypothetical protein